MEGAKIVLDDTGGTVPGDAVYIRRNGNNIVVKDVTLGSEKTLSSITGGVSSHAGLSGLANDDHNSGTNAYLTAGRHTNKHTSDYNNALTITGDVEGKGSIGAHVSSEIMHYPRPAQVIVVAKSSTGQFATIQAAIDSITDSDVTKPYVIEVKGGVYAECVTLNTPYVTLRGAGRMATVIAISSTGSGAAASAVLQVLSSNTEVAGMTIQNTSWDSGVHANPAFSTGPTGNTPTGVIIRDCNLISSGKDCIWAGIESSVSVEFRNCYIAGRYDVCTLVGGAWAFYDTTIDCTQSDGYTQLWLRDDSGSAPTVFCQNVRFAGHASPAIVNSVAAQGHAPTVYMNNCVSRNRDGSIPLLVRTDANQALNVYTRNVENSGKGYTSATVYAGDELLGDVVADSVTASSLIVSSATPASAGSTGTAGMIAWDASFVYICTAMNTWKRAAISTW